MSCIKFYVLLACNSVEQVFASRDCTHAYNFKVLSEGVVLYEAHV